MQGNHCKRSCRDLYPNEPETWCDGCKVDEAEDREANMRRWQESEASRKIRDWMKLEGAAP